MKVSSLEQFKAEVKKALLSRDTEAVIQYQLSTFQFFESTKSWMIRENGLLHCKWGPAVIYSDGTEKWYFMGRLHRTDGPAIIRPRGFNEHWCMGKRIR